MNSCTEYKDENSINMSDNEMRRTRNATTVPIQESFDDELNLSPQIDVAAAELQRECRDHFLHEQSALLLFLHCQLRLALLLQYAFRTGSCGDSRIRCCSCICGVRRIAFVITRHFHGTGVDGGRRRRWGSLGRPQRLHSSTSILLCTISAPEPHQSSDNAPALRAASLKDASVGACSQSVVRAFMFMT